MDKDFANKNIVEDIVISDNFSKNIMKYMFLSFFIFEVLEIIDEKGNYK
jgi:hypothetical protein